MRRVRDMKLPIATLCASLTMVLNLTATDLRFYVGTYTKKDGSQGIYQFRLNSETGELRADGLGAESKNPSFLALHPNGKFLYAVNEIDGSGGVSAYAIESGGKLRPLNQQPSRGAGACHLVVDPSGKNVLVANYGAGSIAVLPIKADGSLAPATGFIQHRGSSVNPQRQKEPHAHSIYTDPAGKLVYVCDLGTDHIDIYKLDAEHGTLTANNPAVAQVAPGSGPRHLALHGDYAYAINEMANTITVFKRDTATGKLEEIQTVATLPDGFSGESSTAEIFVHPNGKFVYGSNRGHDSIAVFARDVATGKLKLVEHESTQGKGPRNFALDPSGKWLIAANQQTNDLVVFKVDETTGKLTPTGQKAELGAPVCVTFLP